MTKDELLVRLRTPYAEAVLIDGLDDALIGFIENGNAQARALYVLDRCVAIMIERLGWTFTGAEAVLRDALTKGWWPASGAPAFAVLAEKSPAISLTLNLKE